MNVISQNYCVVLTLWCEMTESLRDEMQWDEWCRHRYTVSGNFWPDSMAEGGLSVLNDPGSLRHGVGAYQKQMMMLSIFNSWSCFFLKRLEEHCNPKSSSLFFFFFLAKQILVSRIIVDYGDRLYLVPKFRILHWS